MTVPMEMWWMPIVNNSNLKSIVSIDWEEDEKSWPYGTRIEIRSNENLQFVDVRFCKNTGYQGIKIEKKEFILFLKETLKKFEND